MTEKEQKCKELVVDAVKYAKKHFRKATSYDDLYHKYEKWGEKAQKEMMKGKYKGKTLYHWGNLETVIALCEFLDAGTTAVINDSLLKDEFIDKFAEYQRNKIFDRNKQARPDEQAAAEEIEVDTLI
ncbi:MAG: hypothetical protein J6A28_04370 [Clostridia bacterium]|nr:hypothetical protein [Clostridia bacterium]